MARQVEGYLPAIERTDELPALTVDALDRSIEALRETLEQAETRWHRLESRLADQDRAIRELRDELWRTNSGRPEPRGIRSSGVPELTEIVKSVATKPGTVAGDLSVLGSRAPGDTHPGALLERIAALEAFIAGQNDHLEAVEAQLVISRQRVAELESPGSPEP